MSDSSGDLRVSDLEDGAPRDSWEMTHVQSIREVREAEIETRKFALHREREELDTTLITKDVLLQKQVRGITEECGKLRLEVAWLERDLSQIKEAARRQILEAQKEIQAKRLKLEQDVHDNQRSILVLQKRIEEQREINANSESMARRETNSAEDDFAVLVAALNHQIDETRKQLYRADHRFEEEILEAKQTSEMLWAEIKSIKAREPELDRTVALQRAETDKLQKKLDQAERVSQKLKARVRKLTDKRREMRNEMTECDQEDWKSKIQTLHCAKA